MNKLIIKKVKGLIICFSFLSISLNVFGQIPIKKFIPSIFIVDSVFHKEVRDSGFSYDFNRWIQVADMNNDGQKDIIVQPYEHPKRKDGIVSVFYNESNDTTPLFKNQKPFSFYTYGDPAQFTVGDLNSDNKLDVLAPTQNYHGRPEDKPVFLYPNGSDHTPDKLFLQTSSGFKRIDFPDNFNTESGNLLDIDGRGDLKVIISNYTKPMEDWKLRVPVVNTELFPALNWNDHVAGRNTIYDFNDDGIPDIISYKFTDGSPTPPVFNINDYTGKILYSFNLKEFNPNVRDSLNRINHDYGDLNGDGKLDIVLSYMGEWWIGGNTPFDGGRVRFFGINSFILINKGDMEFEVTEIINDPNYVQFNATLGDWDFDGKIDVLFSSMQEGVYYKNLGENKFEKRTLTPLFKQSINLRGVDFDKDGKKDFLNIYVNQMDENGNYTSTDFSQILSVVSDKGVTHYPITGKVIEKHIYIGDATTSFERFNMVDGDGDGDLDLVLGYIQTENSTPGFFQEYYENTGSEFVFKPDYIEIDKNLYGELQVWTYDIDQDGDLDLFYPTYRKTQALVPDPGPRNAYFWWENTGQKFKINKKMNLNFTESNMLYQYDLYTNLTINNQKVDTLIRNTVFESFMALPPPRPTESWKHSISIGMIRTNDVEHNYFAVQDWVDNGQKLDKIQILSFKKGAKLSIFEKSDTVAVIPIIEQVFTKNGRNDLYRYAPVLDLGLHLHDVDNDGKLEAITMEYPNYNGPYDFDMPAGARIQVYNKSGNISEKFLDSALQYDPQKISAANGITMTDINGDGLIDILPFTGWGWRSYMNTELDFWQKIDTQRYIKRVLLNTGNGFKSFHLDLRNRTEDFINQQIGYGHYYPLELNNAKEKSILVFKSLNQSLNAVPAIQLDFSQFKFPCSSYPPNYTLSGKMSFCSGDSSSLKIDSIAGYKTSWYSNGQLLSTKNYLVVKESSNVELHITNLGGCSVEKNFDVIKYDTPNSPILSRDNENNLVSNVNNITWYKDGVKISDTSQKIKPSVNGYYTATTTQNGCTSNISNSYYYLTTSVSNLSNDEYFRVSPNPTNGEIFLNYNIRSTKDVYINVIDANGRIIINNRKVTNGSKLNIGSLATGNYYLQAKDKTGRLLVIEKLIKN